jgi:hypothetical protein
VGLQTSARDNGSHDYGRAVGAAETRVTFENVCDFGIRLLCCRRHTNFKPLCTRTDEWIQ